MLSNTRRSRFFTMATSPISSHTISFSSAPRSRRVFRALVSLALALCASAALAELPPDYASLPGNFFEDDFWAAVVDFSGDGEAEIALEEPTLIYLPAAEEGTGLFEGSDAANTPVAANFDGVGADDIGYFGCCGPGMLCWRMHLSNGSSFTGRPSLLPWCTDPGPGIPACLF